MNPSGVHQDGGRLEAEDVQRRRHRLTFAGGARAWRSPRPGTSGAHRAAISGHAEVMRFAHGPHATGASQGKPPGGPNESGHRRTITLSGHFQRQSALSHGASGSPASTGSRNALAASATSSSVAHASRSSRAIAAYALDASRLIARVLGAVSVPVECFARALSCVVESRPKFPTLTSWALASPAHQRAASRPTRPAFAPPAPWRAGRRHPSARRKRPPRWPSRWRFRRSISLGQTRPTHAHLRQLAWGRVDASRRKVT